MARLSDIVEYCEKRLNAAAFRDFKGASNGLQVENDGTVTKIAAVVDAGLVPFSEAAARGADLVLCHHGLGWDLPFPITGAVRAKLKVLLENNIALYSAHLPLDAHQQIGNNAILAGKLGLSVERWDLAYEGIPMAPVCTGQFSRTELRKRLEALFPRVTELPFGSAAPEKVAIVTGSGNLVLPELRKIGVDTLVTGELRQANFNQAQELGLNLYVCGHYATETFGVQALAAEIAAKFDLPFEFIPTGCPL